MILLWEKVVKLCLESFCSSNLVHFQLEWKNSNCGLYHKHVMIVIDDSSIVGKWSFNLIDDATVIIYDHNRFIIQATGEVQYLNRVKNENFSAQLNWTLQIGQDFQSRPCLQPRLYLSLALECLSHIDIYGLNCKNFVNHQFKWSLHSICQVIKIFYNLKVIHNKFLKNQFSGTKAF